MQNILEKRGLKLAHHLQNMQKQRARGEQQSRNSEQAKLGILDRKKANDMGQTGFFDLLTTLGNGVSQQGLLRQLEPADLQEIARKQQALRGKYTQGILPSQVINAALPVDRQRANDEIPWSHPTFANYIPANKSLVVMFTTAASGKYKEQQHFVSVEFCEFDRITGHFLIPTNSKEQAELDAKALTSTLIKFDCDCGRHTYWYRYVASTGGFAYIGTKPKGREETGFPKIRNPQLKGIACKHVLRTMQSLQRDRGCIQFLAKAIQKQYKVNAGTAKNTQTQTTKNAMQAAIKRQNKANTQVLSDKEQRMSKRLLDRYQTALRNGLLTRNARDKRTPKQKLATLAKIHGVEAYLELIS